MSMRKKMLKNAINGFMSDFDDDVKRMSTRAKLENKPFIIKDEDHIPYITCYMCGSKECEEIKFGNEKMTSIHVMDLCKDCQKIMTDFLLSN